MEFYCEMLHRRESQLPEDCEKPSALHDVTQKSASGVYLPGIALVAVAVLSAASRHN